MNGKAHNTIHALAPVYGRLSMIQKLAVDGFKNGKSDVFVDIRKEAEEGMAQLMMIEKDLVNESQASKIQK